MCNHEMDVACIVEDTERTRFCPQTDEQMDRQGETSITPPPPFNFVEEGGIIITYYTDAYIHHQASVC